MILIAADGWFDAYFLFVWQIALFVSLGESIAGLWRRGGAGRRSSARSSACVLGRRIDAGHGRQAVGDRLWRRRRDRPPPGGKPRLAVARGRRQRARRLASGRSSVPALGAAVYNLAKASPCPFRFHMATEGGWDIGCFAACLLAAALLAIGTPFAVTLLLALPGIAACVLLLWRRYPANTA